MDHNLKDAMPSGSSSWMTAAVALITLFMLGAGGYFLYLYAGTILQHGPSMPAWLLLLLALVGGAASFFSPCSIAITPAFLAYLSGGSASSKETAEPSRRSLFTTAGLVALGIIAFYAVAGALIGALGNVVYNYLIYFIPAVGAVFLLLGALILSRRSEVLAFAERWNPANRFYEHHEAVRPSTQVRSKRTLLSFGLAYGAASHTCSLPIFLGIMLIPLVAGNYLLAALSVLFYGSAIALLILVMTILGRKAFASLRHIGPWLMRATAFLFLGTGIFLIYYFTHNFGPYRDSGTLAKTAIARSEPTFQLTEGGGATGYPYMPRTIVIPTDQHVRLAITDHIGGCLLQTIFEGLGSGGRDVQITVPVGKTVTISLYAPHSGVYQYHCGGNMYSGTIIAK